MSRDETLMISVCAYCRSFYGRSFDFSSHYLVLPLKWMTSWTQRNRKMIGIRVLLRKYVDEEAVNIDIIVGMDKLDVRIPERFVRQVQRELSLINLC